MSKRFKRREAVRGLLGVGLLGGVCLSRSRADAAEKRVGQVRESDFTAVLTAFVAREKVAVVAEDAPFSVTLTEKQAEELRTGLRSEKPEERYQAVAKAFDYECRQEDNILVLRKRYTDIRDLPFVTYEEVRAALDHLDRALAPLDPPVPPRSISGTPFYRFIDALTDEQITFLKEGRPVTVLTLEQRRLLQMVCAKEYMQTYSTLARVNAWYIRQLTRPEAVYRWIQVVPDTPRILVVDGPLRRDGLRVQKGLSHGFAFDSGGPSSLINPQYDTPGKRPGLGSSLFISDWNEATTKMWKDSLTDLRDRTAPTPEILPAPVPSTRVTLGQALERLTARTGGGETYDVDPALAPKPVCLFGGENAPPRGLFEAVARLYALDISRIEDNTFRLVPPHPPRVRGYKDVLPALRRCFPDPYQRYFAAQFRGRMEYIKKPENREGFDKQLTESDPLFRKALALRADIYLKDAIYDAAVRRLRAEIEPQIEKAEGGILQFRDSGVDARRFFTILCVCEVFSRLDPDSGPLTTMPGVTDPDFVSWYDRIDTLTIRADIPPDRSGAVLEILAPDGRRIFEKALGGRSPGTP